MALVIVYQSNGDLLPTTDAIGNMQVALSALDDGNVTFTPDEAPFMFRWRLETPDGSQAVVVERLDETIGGVSARRLISEGKLRPDGGKYYIVPAKRANENGWPVYVNTSGPGPGLAALPILGVARIMYGDLRARPSVLWHAGKLIASLYIAGSVALVYLIARRWLSTRIGLAIALSYGLGTCVWSVSSQALWQHGPASFFLALGIWFLVQTDSSPRSALWCGMALAAATLCRPTCGMLLVVVCGWLARRDWQAGKRWTANAALRASLGAAPLLGLLAIYNWHYLGAPWAFGQTVAGHELALLKCGARGSWQTPLWEGLAGNLISPSRGLFVFSPFLLFATLGGWLAWRRTEFAALRPLAIGIGLMLIVESKHYDWWGGWTYGYRHIVDLAPLCSILLIPAMGLVVARRGLALTFGALVVWSILVQSIGAFAYDGMGWNAPLAGYRLVPAGASEPVVVADASGARKLIEAGAAPLGEYRLDIDLPEHRHRLWSLRDNEILYYLTHWRESRDWRAEQSALAKLHAG